MTAAAATLAIGNRVTVYEDPYTRQKVEGVATLMKHGSIVGLLREGDLEWWQVNFDDDEIDQYVHRWVHPQDRID